jgi:hypothetical protein
MLKRVGVWKGGLFLVQRRLLLFHLRLCHFQQGQRRKPVGVRRIQIASGNEILGKKGPVPFQRSVGVLQGGLRLFHIGCGSL